MSDLEGTTKATPVPVEESSGPLSDSLSDDAKLLLDRTLANPIESMVYGEGPEHKFLGNCIDLWFPSPSEMEIAKRADITSIASSFNHKHNRTTWLKFGMIVQLAGDFYTTWSGMEPISDSPDSDRFTRFKSAVDSMIEDKDDYLRDVMAKLVIQDDAIRKAQNLNVDPATIYHDTGPPYNQPTDFDFLKVTGFKYAKIAYRNLDHFGNDARKCYQIGHEIACQLAKEARSLPPGSDQNARLEKAYLYDAFACHYLTDLFSSGHLRVPRRPLHDDALFTAYTGGAAERPVWDVQARYMHDDDSATGLWVRNDFGDEWIAYGDKQLFSPQCRVNARHCVSAVQASANEVFWYFQHDAGPPDSRGSDRRYKALKWAPLTQSSDDKIDYNNTAALWRVMSSFPDGFGQRSKLDDHANFTVRPGKPGYAVYPIVSDAAKNVKTATFRQDSKQYPGARPIEIAGCGKLLSGGFVQVSTQPVPSDRSNARSNVRFWCPIKEPALGKGDKGLMHTEQQLITLRCVNTKPVDATLRFLHCLSFVEDAVTVVIRFYMQEDGNQWAKRVLARAQFFRNNKWSGNNIDQNSSIPESSVPDPAGNIAEGAQFEELGPDSQADIEIMEVTTDLTLAHLAVTRFFIQPRTQTHPPRVVALSINLDGAQRNKAQVGMVNIDPAGAALTKAYSYNINEHDKQYYMVGAPHVSLDSSSQHVFMKCWGDDLWLVAKLDEANRHMSTYLLQEQNNFIQDRPQAQVDVDSYGGDGIVAGAKPCLLAISQRGKRLVLVISEKTPQTNQITDIVSYRLDQSLTYWNTAGFYKSLSNDTKRVYRNYFIGAMPHQWLGDTFDLVKVSGRKDLGTNKSYLMIQLYRAGKPWDTNVVFSDHVETLLEDPLQNDPNFYSLRFLRCVFEKSYGSFMQVYSYYGVLGYRIFNLDVATGIYKLGGQVSYMGQPSQVAGLGNYGQWGCGIMPWGQTEPWLDEAYFTVANNGSNINERGHYYDGSWGINKQDFSRRLRDGMNPGDRPDWCLY